MWENSFSAEGFVAFLRRTEYFILRYTLIFPKCPYIILT
jgi:hypothetical protein